MTEADTLHVLVADDQPDVREALRLLLRAAGHSSVGVDNPGALVDAASGRKFDVVLMDMNYTRDTTSGREGIDALRAIAARGDAPPVIVMTAWGSLELAVEAMRCGAVDFVQKPWDNTRLLDTLAEQAGRGREASKRREELDIARSVQRNLLPPAGVRTAGRLQCAAECVPAREVGGDYYDYLEFGPGRLGIVLADVSGKGVSAAMLMANLQALFRTGLDLAAVNAQFHRSTPVEQYATLFHGVWDNANSTLIWSNCGHPAPVLRRVDGTIETLESCSAPVGLFADLRCERRKLSMRPGDTLVLYSDGIAETPEAVMPYIDCGEPEEILRRLLTLTADGDADDRTAVVIRASE